MKVDQEIFSAVMADSLAQGQAVRVCVQGVSMLPWLRAGQRVRIVPAVGRRLRPGDIALFWRAPDRPVLHRIVRVHRAAGLCECLGDSESAAPELVSATAVVGIVETTALRRLGYLALSPARRYFNRLCRKWGLRLRHG